MASAFISEYWMPGSGSLIGTPYRSVVRSPLKQGGILYTGFKYGTFEGMRNGRYFTDFTEETFRAFLDECPGFTELEHWVTADVRPGRGEEKWFNVLLKKYL